MALTRPRYSQIYDTDYKQSVRVATTADAGNLVAGYQSNTVDGKTLIVNDRILVKNQSNTMQNGIYYVTVVGAGSNGTWLRAIDADADDKVTSGLTTVIADGNVNVGKSFRLTTPDPIFLGNTGLTFVDPSASPAPAGANTQVQFNDAGITSATAGLTFNKFSNVLTVGGSLTTLNSGNISAGGYFLGNGSQLTGLPSSYSNVQVATYLPTYTGVVTAGNVTVNGNVTASYFSGNGALLIGLPIATYLPTYTGNVNAAYYFGNGSQLTGLPSSYGNVQVATYLPTYTGNVGKIYYDPNNGFVGFNDTSPDYVYDFYSPTDAGEILHIEGGVGTQAFFGARNSSGLTYAAGADQTYAFSGTIDTTNDYALITNNIVRANIQGSSGNVIFTQSITVAKDLSTTTLGIGEIRGTASNITVRSNITLLGTNLIGAGKLVIGTENVSTEMLFVAGDTYLDGDVTISGNLFVNGNVTTINANNLSIADSMIYLAEDNPADILDIGLVSAFTDAVGYQHTGFVRDASDGTWKLFANVVTEPTTTIDFTGASYANLLVGNIAGKTSGFTLGYLEMPQVTSANVTLALADSAKHFYRSTTAPHTITIPLNSSVAFGNGTVVSIVNQAVGNITVTPTAGVSLYLGGNSTSAGRTITTYGVATLMKVSTNTWFVNGTGVV